MLGGIAIDRNSNVYVTVPRFKRGVPATLNILDLNTKKLTPYPDWGSQLDLPYSANDKDLANAMALVIDSQSRMWVLDAGIRYIMEPYEQGDDAVTEPEECVKNDQGTCKYYGRIGSPGPDFVGIFLFDLEEKNTAPRKFNLANDVTPDDEPVYCLVSCVDTFSSFVTAIAVDETKDIAYISDAGTGSIIIFDLKNKKGRKYAEDGYTTRDLLYTMLVGTRIYGENIPMAAKNTDGDRDEYVALNVAGLSLSKNSDILYFSSIQGGEFFHLKNHKV